MTRRDLLGACTLAALHFPRGVLAATLAGQPPTVERERSAEEWMDDVMGAKSANGLLQLGRFVEPIYFLTESIGWKPDGGEKLPSVNVPKGFVTDLASIPRVFFSLLRPDAEYAYAAIIHDYLYWTQNVSRDVADTILKRVMEEFQVTTLKLQAVYQGVRIGSGYSWDQNAKLKKSGERRILREYPTEPVTRWSDWKRRPNALR